MYDRRANEKINIALIVFQYTSELREINTVWSAHNLILQVNIVDPILPENSLNEPCMCY